MPRLSSLSSPPPSVSLVAYIIPRRCSRGRYLYLLPCGSRGNEIEFSVSILRSPRPRLSSARLASPMLLAPFFFFLSSPSPPPPPTATLASRRDRPRRSSRITAAPTLVEGNAVPASVLRHRGADILSGPIDMLIRRSSNFAPGALISPTKYCAYNDKLARNGDGYGIFSASSEKHRKE